MAGVYYRQAGGADKKADGQTSNGLLLLFEVMFGVSGRVYNITPYLEFHPGGVDEIMRGAGKDGTQLFNEIHKWVNVESMLASCYIGPLKAKTKAKAKARRTHNPNTESKSQIAASPMTLEVPQPTASTLSSCMFHMPFHLASSLNISSLHCWLDFQLLI
jgi:hypothetical protein